MSKKTSRMLSIFEDLLNNKRISSSSYLNESGAINEIENKALLRTFSRDIRDIRTFLEDKHPEIKLEFNKQSTSYRLTSAINEEDTLISYEEIFAVLKIIICMRAFNKDEMEGIVKNMLSLVPKEQQKRLNILLNNESTYYKKDSNKGALLKLIGDIGEILLKGCKINILHKSENTEERIKLTPINLLFYEYDYYLIALLEGEGELTFIKLDNIISFDILKESCNYSDMSIKRGSIAVMFQDKLQI